LSDEKNFLQTIKLEISRSFRLEPYERKAFHRILALVKSQQGKDILLREIEKGGEIRQSAISVLSEFKDPSLLDVFIKLLEKDLSDDEKILILKFFSEFNDEKILAPVINLIEKNKGKKEQEYLIKIAFNALKQNGADKSELLQFLNSVINDQNSSDLFLEGAINALSVFRNISAFEDLLKRNNDRISYYVFSSLYSFNLSLKQDIEDEEDYSSPEWSPPKNLTPEDELLLQIKVLLGKMTARFEDFSVDTKIAFLNAMLSCNHRESVIYIMKALESKNLELVKNTLYSLYSNIIYLRSPEKIFRSLISMSVESGRYNELIVDIFTKYFTVRSVSRSDILFRDKQYGNITSTLEAFFETYRREFMIPDVVENAFPESFRNVRQYILRNLDPEHKRRLVTAFTSEAKTRVRDMIDIIADWVFFIKEEEKESVSQLIDLMLDEDRISLENSASRIDSVNFEKRYLQSRIIRLCNIISSLKIEGAAKSLVFIYNYLKKYPDREIFEAAVNALCRMNYSYMLSEVEIMLTAGSPEEQELAVKLLPLFTEKRLVNILVEFLKQNVASESSITAGIVSILAGQDIKSNINAVEVFKEIIEKNPDPAIKQTAITGIGHCAVTEDIEYLNSLFYKFQEQKLKESIVKAIASIMAYRSDYNKQSLAKMVQEYLKDPGIKVRIFSCMILIRLGNKDAFRSIREMLIIKNKGIQREILSILRDIRTPDFYFFLVSLLREEFGISMDIINVLEKLPQEDLKELETFIINMFRKFEIPQGIGVQAKEQPVVPLDRKECTVLLISIENFNSIAANLNFFQLIELYLTIDSLILPSVEENTGIISHKDSHYVAAVFQETDKAVLAGSGVIDNITSFNKTVPFSRRIYGRIIVLTDTFPVTGDEIIDPVKLGINSNLSMPLANCMILGSNSEEVLRDRYYSTSIPELLYSNGLSDRLHYEFVTLLNFRITALSMLQIKEEEIAKQKEIKAQIDAQVKLLSTGNRSTTSIAIAGELENVGIKMKSMIDEIEAYMNRRSTDRELNRSVRQMLLNVYNFYRVEISKLQIK
jgi:HEAT repeat protein